MVGASADKFISTANLADGCLQTRSPFAVSGAFRSVVAGSNATGCALPVTHFGSVDIFLEALDSSNRGDVLIVDNQGRSDE